jgi:hypothetical protein
MADTCLTREDEKLIRLATAWADFLSAKKAFLLYDACPDEEMNYHLLLSLVTCYGRPFLRRDGIGPLTDEYKQFPDFSDEGMNDRHYYFVALRHVFYAHTTLDGVRLKLVPPNVPNPDKPVCRNKWDFNLGVRTFAAHEYKVHIRATYPIIPELMTRLEKDIALIVPTVAKKYTGALTPFEIDTGAQTFDLKEAMAEMKKRDRSRQHGVARYDVAAPPVNATVRTGT